MPHKVDEKSWECCNNEIIKDGIVIETITIYKSCCDLLKVVTFKAINPKYYSI